MELADRLARLEADGTRLIELARRDLSVAVPSCPGWTAGDLLEHATAEWTGFAIHVETSPTEPVFLRGDLPDLAPEDALARVVEALAGRPPEAPMWTSSSDQTVGFFQRRAHQETLIHRVDAELAAGDRTPVPPEDGIDGVDEFFTHLAQLGDAPLPRGSLHLHQTDGDGEFMLAVVDDAIVMSREHAKGDAALRASGEELLLVIWGRRGLEGLELFGDADVAAQWTRLAP